jgi:transposase-like protein
MSSSKKARKQYDLEYKRRIVQEYLRGEISTMELAHREGLDRGQIYHWKVQLAERTRHAEIEEIADSQGVSLDQARQIRELQEELEATQKKVAQLLLENDLLKKIQPSSQFTKKSSSYIETKQLLARFKGRAK